MIIIRGEPYATTVDAALELGVSTKTIIQYIHKGIIPPPPEVNYGVRLLKHFPADYMRLVREALAIYRHKTGSAKSVVR